MSFLYPAWFTCLIIIPLILCVVIIMRKNRAKVWSAFVSKQHKSELIRQNKPNKFWISLTLSLLGLTCIIIAMARPYAGKSVSREKIHSRNILIAMDTSLSMLCEDVQPNRLGSAVTFAVNLIQSLPNDHIGIMAFSGSPNVITSLSIDHPSIIEELGHLNTSSAHIAGSNLKDALYEGINTLKRAGKQANALIIVTDGTEKLDEINQITKFAKESYVQIFTVGIGTSAGGTIPINGQPHRDTQRKVVITKLQDKILRQLARDTSGVYINNKQQRTAITEAIQSMSQFEQEGREVQIPKELYQWFLAPGVFCLLISTLLNTRFKSSFPILKLITLAFLSTPSKSSANEPSWLDQISTEYLTRPAQVQAGYTALNKKDYATAIDSFKKARERTTGNEHSKLSLAIAQSAYRLGDYELASQEYSQALVGNDSNIQNIAQYNLANTLFKKHTKELNVPNGTNLATFLEKQIRNKKMNNETLDQIEKGLENSLTHYTDLLKIKPKHNSATSNKKTTQNIITTIKETRKKIEEEKKQQKNKKKDKKENNNPESKKDKKLKNNNDKKQTNQKEDKPENKNTEEKNTEEKNQTKKQDNKQNTPNSTNQKEDKSENKNTEEKNQTEKQDNKQNGTKNSDDNTPNEEKTNKQPQPQKRTPESNTQKPAEFKNKEEALEFLKKHADSRKKPLTNRRGYYNRPTIDW